MSDVVVIGGGIAGVSAAAYLAESMDVVLLEAESVLAYHTTGRSAALFYPNYGHQSIRPLSHASGRFFSNPEFTDHPLLSPRGVLTLEVLDQHAEVPDEGGERIDADRVRELLPIVSEIVHGGIWQPEPADLDVAAIHQAFVRKLRAHGGIIRSSSRVTSLRHSGGKWRVAAGDDIYDTQIVVNAAGAWADVIAAMAGIRPVGLIPKRRTAFMVEAPEEEAGWPLAHDVDMGFYFKPDGPQLLCSLADETPSEPCDAQAREVDVALAIARINAATTLGIRSVRTQWAGLRTFAPDEGMVIGSAPDSEGFFWLAGQGGTGIQTSPAAGRLLASLVSSGTVPQDLTDAGLNMAQLSPGRFA